MHAAVVIGLMWAGFALLRNIETREADPVPWFLSAVVLLLIAGAGRLRLVDGQLLVLSALAYAWWSVSASSQGRLAAVGRAGRFVFLGLGFIIGMAAVFHAGGHLVQDLSDRAGGSWLDVLRVSGEVARSDPSLKGLQPLHGLALVVGAATVACVWVQSVQGMGKIGDRFRRSVGLLLLLEAGVTVGSGWANLGN